MPNTPNYTATQEDSRPWRAVQDAEASAKDVASEASGTATAARTAIRARENGIVVTPNPTTVSAGVPTRQLTATQLSDPVGTVTWVSSDPGKATVSAAGLVTRVAAGTTTITATSLQSTGGKTGGIATAGSVVVTVS